MTLLGNLWSIAAWMFLIYVGISLLAEWRRGGAE